jgi:hypothetical protein
MTLSADPRLHMDYATLSLDDVRTGLEAVARDAQTAFGNFDVRQLNWRPDATQWSVAQCFDHLITVNHLMFQAADEAMNGTAPPSIWQRLPFLPGILGPLLVRSQAPETARKFKAAPKAMPAASDIGADVIRRFVEQHHDAVARVRALDERKAARIIMISPIARVVSYSVLNGWRLLLAHDRRHFEQARRVTRAPAFPGS